MPESHYSRYIDLLEQRVVQPAFHPAADQQVVHVDNRVFSVLRESRDGTSRVLSLINVSEQQVPVRLSLADLGFAAHQVEDLVSKQAIAVDDGTLRKTLAPYQVLWLSDRKTT